MKTYFENLYRGTFLDLQNLISKKLKKRQKMFIVTANPESYMIAQKDPIFSEIVRCPSYTVVADGVGVVKACQYLKIDSVSKITGVDITTFLLQKGNEYHASIYLLGAKEDVIQQLVIKIQQTYPKLKILGYTNGYDNNKEKTMEEIIKKQPDIVLVALGIPNQEKLIHQYYNQAQKGIFIGVGGTFDVLSGSKKRAPQIFRKLNLEWLYRLCQEPARWKRFYQNNIKFLFQLRK